MGKTISIIGIIFLAHWVKAQVPNELDLSFGNLGKSEIDIDDLDHLSRVIASDSTIYFAGYTGYYDSSVNYDAIIGRLADNGEIDSSFNGVGYARFDFPGDNHSVINDIAIGDSGIYFIGNSLVRGNIDTLNLFIGKLNWDGMIDSSFAQNGFYSPTILGSYDNGQDIEVLSGEKIIFCGSTTNNSTQLEHPLMGRLEYDGSLDTTFGTTGIRIWSWDGTLGDGVENIYLEKHGAGGYLTQLELIGNDYFFSGYYVADFNPMCLMLMVDVNGELKSNYAGLGYRVFEVAPNFENYIMSTEYNEGIIYSVLDVGGSSEGDLIVLVQDTLGIVQNTISYSNQGNKIKIKDLALTPNGDLAAAGYFKSENSGDLVDSEGMFTLALNSSGNIQEDYCEVGWYVNTLNSEACGIDAINYKNESLYLGGFVKGEEINNVSNFSILKLNYNPVLTVVSQRPEEVKVYPIPFVDYINIEVNSSIQKVCLLDGSGQEIKRVDEINNGVRFDLKEYESGIYFLSYFEKASSRHKVKKLVKY